MSYSVRIVDNDNGNVLLDSDRIEVLLGSYVERVDEWKCSCNMGVFLSSVKVPVIATACDALSKIISDLEVRYPAITYFDKFLSGVVFDSEDELDAALSAMKERDQK